MRVFVTGSTGYIGSEVVQLLRDHGHDVVGLTRSAAGVEQLARMGVASHLGDTLDFETIRPALTDADAVIHLAHNHDFTAFAENCKADGLFVRQLGSALSDTGKTLIVTSVTALGLTGTNNVAVETALDEHSDNLRVATELASRKAEQAGVDVRVIRLSQVHDTARQGLLTFYVEIARRTGIAAYVDEGANRWPAVHRRDAVALYGLVLEQGHPRERYNAVAEEGVTMREIAEVVGARLGVPVASIPADAAQAQFGWFAMFAGMDQPASSARTRYTLSWRPAGPKLLADLGSV